MCAFLFCLPHMLSFSRDQMEINLILTIHRHPLRALQACACMQLCHKQLLCLHTCAHAHTHTHHTHTHTHAHTYKHTIQGRTLVREAMASAAVVVKIHMLTHTHTTHTHHHPGTDTGARGHGFCCSSCMGSGSVPLCASSASSCTLCERPHAGA